MARSRLRCRDGVALACCLIALLTSTFLPKPAHAADRFWNLLFGGPFNAASSWQGGFIPGVNDVAHFGRTTNPNLMQLIYTVDFDVSPTNQSLRIEDDFVTFDLNGHTYTTSQFVGNEIGNIADRAGKLTITDGTWSIPTTNAQLYIGTLDTSTGSLTVSTNGRITGATQIFAGLLGTGSLTIQNGGTVQAQFVSIGQQTTAVGTAFVTGPGSILNSTNVSVGQFGNGTLNITNGGLVQSAFGSTIGTFADAVGTATLDGANSRWINSGSLLVGNEGYGTLTLTNSAQVQNTEGHIGSIAGSTGTATVASGAIWTNTGNLFVGSAGDGTLTIQSGGKVTSVVGVVGDNAGSEGTANVDGTSSTWTTGGNLGVGYGTLTISNGGTIVTNGPFGTLADAADANATVTVVGAGSTWILNNALLAVGDDGTAALNVLDGGAVSNLNGVIGADMSATGTAVVRGAGSQWVNLADLTIGDTGVGSLTIDMGASVSNDFGRIAQGTGSSGTVVVDGSGSTWTSASSLQVGNLGQASLTITDGGTVSSSSTEIGGVVGITSSAIVDGTGSLWTNAGGLEIGDAGDGELTISNGGRAMSGSGTLADGPDVAAVVTVTGAGSEWEMSTATSVLYVGEDGTGTLNILSGGTVSNADGHVGFDSGSHGTALVSGAGSTWTNTGSLSVGTEGEGTLTITNGSSVSDHFGFIGTFENSSGAATVSGAGSTWNHGLFFGVGNFGSGTLAIESGGTVVSPRGFIAAGVDAIGDVTVSGAGSTWTSTQVFVVGFEGDADLSITSGGSVISHDAWIAGAATSTASVTVAGSGSNWTISGRLAVSDAFDPDELGPGGGTGTFRIQPGATVTVAEETALFTGANLILEGGTLDTGSVTFNGGTFNWVSGTLHVGTFNSTLVNQGGTLAPGHSAGTTTITGGYAQLTAATLEIEIGGTSPGSTYDVVNIMSIAGLTGELDLAILGSFVPSPSNTFTVLSAAGGIFGAFSNVANGQRINTIDGSGSFLVHYGSGSPFNPNHVVLSSFIANPLPGDFNLDGIVDTADYVMWRKTIGVPAAYSTWRVHFGETPGSGSATSGAVPEPGTVLPLLVAAVAGLSKLRRARRNQSPSAA